MDNIEEIRQWLSDYDNGSEVESLEMIGIGIGFEQAIQHLTIEITRERLLDQVGDYVDIATKRLSNIYRFSRSEIGVAKKLSSFLFNKGISETLKIARESEPERIIKIQKIEVPGIINYFYSEKEQ